MEPGLGQAASLGQLDEWHLIPSRVMPSLDPGFRPAALVAARFSDRVRESPQARRDACLARAQAIGLSEGGATGCWHHIALLEPVK
jgi:hypothetical protein